MAPSRSVLLLCALAMSAWAQTPSSPFPKFEDYPVKEIFKGIPAEPVLTTPEELKFQAVIVEGVSKGWGVFDGTTGKEMTGPGPNFAGHYILVSFGCGEADLIHCLQIAIVDATTGRVYPPPSPSSPEATMPYFGVFSEAAALHPSSSFHNVATRSPFEYRLDSRLLIARICEGYETHGGSIVSVERKGCGPHYYLVNEEGLKLIHRIVE